MAEKVLELAVNDVPPEIENGWNKWCDKVYMSGRLGLPGFLSARRFCVIDIKDKPIGNHFWQFVTQRPRYLTLFDLAGAEALASAPYLEARAREASSPADSFEALTPRLPGCSRGLYRQIYPDREYRDPSSRLLFAVGLDIPPENEDEFNAWYRTEHIPALESVPGFLTARRFASLPPSSAAGMNEGSPGPKYIALYDIASEDVFESEDFHRARQSPWTTRMKGLFTTRFRLVSRQTYP